MQLLSKIRLGKGVEVKPSVSKEKDVSPLNNTTTNPITAAAII